MLRLPAIVRLLTPETLFEESMNTTDCFIFFAPLGKSTVVIALLRVKFAAASTLPAPEGVLYTKLPVPLLPKNVPAAPTVEGQLTLLPFLVIPLSVTLPASSMSTSEFLSTLPDVFANRGTASIVVDVGPATKLEGAVLLIVPLMVKLPLMVASELTDKLPLITAFFLTVKLSVLSIFRTMRLAYILYQRRVKVCSVSSGI